MFFSLKDTVAACCRHKSKGEGMRMTQTPVMSVNFYDEIHRAFAKPGVVSRMWHKFETRSEQACPLRSECAGHFFA